MRRKNKKVEPLRYRIYRSILIILGPSIYLAISVLPWLSGDIQIALPKFPTKIELPRVKLPKINLPSFVSKRKSAQIGDLTLTVDPSSENYEVQLNAFKLRWNQDRPLFLIMADGSEQQLLPSAYRVQEDQAIGEVIGEAIILSFGADLELSFYPEAEGLKIKLNWLSGQDLPAAIRLPWDVTAKTENGQLVLEAGMYFTALADIELTDIELTNEQYLEIPLDYYAFIEGQSPSNISLMTQQQNLGGGLYQNLYAHYRNRLLSKLQKEELETAEAAALYLEILLGDNADPKVYEQAYKQMRLLAQQNSWSSLHLAPYLGISQSTLAEDIRQDNERINQVRNNYLGSNWDFADEKDTANLLFNYGYLKLLLAVTQRAIELKQQQGSMEERFYLHNFLWQLGNIYPRNGYIQATTASAEFRSQLEELSQAWEQGFPPEISIRFVLDVLRALWSFPDLQPQHLAIKLFQLMDSNGMLPEFYGQQAESFIPFYEAWHALSGPILASLHPRNTTVVPGFWIWTLGAPEVFYQSGQPIVVKSGNFSQTNKLLLLRGIYFYPQEVTIDGQAISQTGQIMVPGPGKSSASWFYNPEYRYLAIETVASEQNSSEIIVR